MEQQDAPHRINLYERSLVFPWQNVLPCQPLADKAFSSLGTYFFRFHAQDIKHDGKLENGYLVIISAGAPCLVTRKTENGTDLGQLAAGDIFITSPCKQLTWQISGQGDFIGAFLSMRYIRDVASSLNIPDKSILIKEKFQYKDRLVACLFEAIGEHLSASGYPDHIYTEAMSRALCTHLLHNSREADAEHIHFGKRVFSCEQIEKIQHYIDERIEQRIFSAELAKCVYVSDYHFYRIFRRTTGMTPQQFIKKRRLHIARQQIEYSSLQLSEIAYKSGFVDQSHMAREIRSAFGRTPSQLRILQEHERNFSLPLETKSSPVLAISILIQEVSQKLFDYFPAQLMA